MPPAFPGPVEATRVGRWTLGRRQGPELVATTANRGLICREIAKPSDGLQPSTPPDRKMSGSGGGGCVEDDGVAERFELADELTGFPLLVDVVGAEVGAEVSVAAAGVGEEVPDDYEDRTGDGDERFEFAEAAVAVRQFGRATCRRSTASS